MLLNWLDILSAITWQNLANLFINIGVTGIVFWAVLQFVVKKTIDYKVSQKMQKHKSKLDKELEVYKTELLMDIKVREQKLQILTEEVKLDNIRRAQDFNLYTNKRHEAYTKLNELLIAAYSAAYGIILNFGPDFREMTDEEIIEWLDKRKFGQKDKNNVITLLDKSRSQAESELTSLWHSYNIHAANVTFAELKNYYLASKLYLSQTITTYLNDYISKSSVMLSYHDSDGQIIGLGTEVTSIDKDMSELIDKMTLVMKSELKRGYYPDDD